MMNLWFIFHCRIYNHHLLKYCFRNVFNKCLSLEFFYGSIKAVPNKLCVQLYNFHNFMIRILWPWGLKWCRKWLNTTLWQYKNHAFPLQGISSQTVISNLTLRERKRDIFYNLLCLFSRKLKHI